MKIFLLKRRYAILLIVVLIYIFMFTNTNSIFNYAKKVFLGEISMSSDEALSRYSLTSFKSRTQIGNVELKIRRNLVIHNFFDGYMFVKYSRIVYDTDGQLLTATANVNSIWKIHKTNGDWSITEIYESP